VAVVTAPSPLADDATRERCALCGREIVRACLDGGRRVALDHPEIGVVPDLDDLDGRVVLLDAAGRAWSPAAAGRTTNVAQHTRHRCGQGGEAA
jgi:hypothetical protein